jgi:bifunctional non-homologous end joining protein LigD
MALTEYRRKRDFTKTPEPAGKSAPKKKPGPLAFVVQQHRARRLHYDFRLELDGVLKSWAVPKGPSLDPAEKRLAVQVEDHPLEYGEFEGVIPEGEYGGGTVMLWDRGTWTPADPDPAAAYENGTLKFRLDGEKLHGNWALVRMSGKTRGARRVNWLLIKERDAAAAPGSGDAVVLDNPLSVATGRALDVIAADRDRVWKADSEAPTPAAAPARAPGRPAAPAPPRASRRRASRPYSDVVYRPATAPDGEESRKARRSNGREESEVAGMRLTHPDRVLYPESGITKRDLANYYKTIRDWALPHLRHRALSLVRCPEGYEQACFFQKHVGSGAPEVLGRIEIAEKSGTDTYLVIENIAGLVALVQMGVLEIHPWGSTVERLETPDRVTFDLDPASGLPWSRVVAAALDMRATLAQAGLASFVKTTGGKGLHIVVPLVPRLDWDKVKAFSKSIAEAVAARAPERYTVNPSKPARTGRIYIDYLRNSRGATAIGAYSPRARPGAPVATPLFWEEVERGVRSDAFTVRTLPQRLARLDQDPWAEIGTLRQSVSAATRKKFGL